MSGTPFFKTARVSDEAMRVKDVTAVHFDPGIPDCTPVFCRNARSRAVPIDYIEGGHSLKESLDDSRPSRGRLQSNAPAGTSPFVNNPQGR